MLTWSNILNFAQNGTPQPDQRIEKTATEWQAQLTLEQYRVTRKKGTEAAFSGEYCQIHQAGLYACICCGAVLFDSRVKFESGTGWPSFTQPAAENAVKYESDNSYGMQRVETLCNTCDAHLGHIFPDGPAPSGLRYCINSVSIRLVESDST